MKNHNETIRVIRVLEFVGDREWIVVMLRRNWLSQQRAEPALRDGCRARELVYIEEVLTHGQDQAPQTPPAPPASRRRDAAEVPTAPLQPPERAGTDGR